MPGWCGSTALGEGARRTRLNSGGIHAGGGLKNKSVSEDWGPSREAHALRRTAAWSSEFGGEK